MVVRTSRWSFGGSKLFSKGDGTWIHTDCENIWGIHDGWTTTCHDCDHIHESEYRSYHHSFTHTSMGMALSGLGGDTDLLLSSECLSRCGRTSRRYGHTFKGTKKGSQLIWFDVLTGHVSFALCHFRLLSCVQSFIPSLRARIVPPMRGMMRSYYPIVNKYYQFGSSSCEMSKSFTADRGWSGTEVRTQPYQAASLSPVDSLFIHCLNATVPFLPPRRVSSRLACSLLYN